MKGVLWTNLEQAHIILVFIDWNASEAKKYSLCVLEIESLDPFEWLVDSDILFLLFF